MEKGRDFFIEKMASGPAGSPCLDDVIVEYHSPKRKKEESGPNGNPVKPPRLGEVKGYGCDFE